MSLDKQIMRLISEASTEESAQQWASHLVRFRALEAQTRARYDEIGGWVPIRTKLLERLHYALRGLGMATAAGGAFAESWTVVGAGASAAVLAEIWGGLRPLLQAKGQPKSGP